MHVNRRYWLVGAGAAATALYLARWAQARARGVLPVASGAPMHWEVEHPQSEWRHLLTAEQYAVLREGGTEYAFSSPLNHEKRAGTFRCAGCALALFSSDTKFDSGTGWPSFWQPLEKAVGTTTDDTLGMRRIAVHCRRCGGHLGHVFDDGPPPTGLRYCINGVALTFEAKEGKT